MLFKWEFQKIRGTLFWGPYNKDPYYLGYFLRVPYFRKLPNRARFSRGGWGGGGARGLGGGGVVLPLSLEEVLVCVCICEYMCVLDR